jgi:2-keto-4-pentenoate hydratase/2-oxohepta-3-ene-1,7-dioic acid hydratase in catechol pathway
VGLLGPVGAGSAAGSRKRPIEVTTSKQDSMKIVRYGQPHQEKPGILDSDGDIHDISGIVPEIAGQTPSPVTLASLKSIELAKLPNVSGAPRFGPCVGRVGKFVCIGLNYSDHAAEAGMRIPSEPVIFMKATSAICGPNDDIVIPRDGTKTDWEVELGVVIGTPAKYVSEADAMSHVAGYCVINDLSDRAFQLEGTGQCVKGKSADTFGPIGPWLVTADEVPDPQDLKMWLEVDGHRYQNGSTRTMIFGVPNPETLSPLVRHDTTRPTRAIVELVCKICDSVVYLTHVDSTSCWSTYGIPHFVRFHCTPCGKLNPGARYLST